MADKLSRGCVIPNQLAALLFADDKDSAAVSGGYRRVEIHRAERQLYWLTFGPCEQAGLFPQYPDVRYTIPHGRKRKILSISRPVATTFALRLIPIGQQGMWISAVSRRLPQFRRPSCCVKHGEAQAGAVGRPARPVNPACDT